MCGFRFSTSYQFIQSVSKETRMKKIFGLMISSNASMEEAVTAEIQDEKFGGSWKKRKHPRLMHEDRRDIQEIPSKIQEGR
jgi:hypothetical protein